MSKEDLTDDPFIAIANSLHLLGNSRGDIFIK